MPHIDQPNRPFWGLSISFVLHATLICVLATMKNSPHSEIKPPNFLEVATIVLKPDIKDPISTVSTEPQAEPGLLLEPKTVKAPIKEKPKKVEKLKTKPKAKPLTKQVKSTPFSASPGSDSHITTAPTDRDTEKPLAPTGDNHEATGKAGGSDGGSDNGNVGGGGSGGVSDTLGLVVLSRVLPRYPPRAEARGIEGWVLLEITVTPIGTISKARVVDANPKEIFDQAALEAIRQWQFKSAFKDGRPIAQRATLKIMFRLKKQR